MGRIGCVRCEKSRRDFVARTFTLIAPVHTVLHRVQLRNHNKCTATLWNIWKHEFRVQWGGLGAFIAKNPDVTSWHELFALIAPVHPVLHRVSWSYKMIPNAPKLYTTIQNMSLGPNGADWVRSLRKISMWIHGTNFCINCTSSPRFAPSFM